MDKNKRTVVIFLGPTFDLRGEGFDSLPDRDRPPLTDPHSLKYLGGSKTQCIESAISKASHFTDPVFYFLFIYQRIQLWAEFSWVG